VTGGNLVHGKETEEGKGISVENHNKFKGAIEFIFQAFYFLLIGGGGREREL